MLKFASTNKSLNPDWPLTYKIMPPTFRRECSQRILLYYYFLWQKWLSMKKGSPRTYVRWYLSMIINQFCEQFIYMGCKEVLEIQYGGYLQTNYLFLAIASWCLRNKYYSKSNSKIKRENKTFMNLLFQFYWLKVARLFWDLCCHSSVDFSIHFGRDPKFCRSVLWCACVTKQTEWKRKG